MKKLGLISLCAVAALAPFLAIVSACWPIIGSIFYWGWILSRPPGPPESTIVASGYTQIAEARQIDDLYGPARHSIANYGPGGTADWITEAHFGGCYELRFVVRISIDSAGAVVGCERERRFNLLQVSRVSPAPSAGASFNSNSQIDFGPVEWEQVVAADGSLAALGVDRAAAAPVDGFEHYANYPQHGLRMTIKPGIPK